MKTNLISATFRIIMFTISISMVFFSFVLPLAQAAASAQVTLGAGWKPSSQNNYVFYGTQSERTSLSGQLKASKPKEGTLSKSPVNQSFYGSTRIAFENSFGFEGELDFSKHAISLFQRTNLLEATNTIASMQNSTIVMVSGVKISTLLKAFYEFSFEQQSGASFSKDERAKFTLETSMGFNIQNYSWKTKKHTGNLGLALGIKPKFGGFSALLQTTLAAIPTASSATWGKLMDANSLRAALTYEMWFKKWAPSLGVEFSHSHQTYFGSKLTGPNEALFFDELKLSMIAGVLFEI